MDEKLIEALLPFLEKMLAAITAAGQPGVGMSPMMGHLPGLHEELARLRAQLVAHAETGPDAEAPPAVPRATVGPMIDAPKTASAAMVAPFTPGPIIGDQAVEAERKVSAAKAAQDKLDADKRAAAVKAAEPPKVEPAKKD